MFSVRLYTRIKLTAQGKPGIWLFIATEAIAQAIAAHSYIEAGDMLTA